MFHDLIVQLNRAVHGAQLQANSVVFALEAGPAFWRRSKGAHGHEMLLRRIRRFLHPLDIG